ncbi:hypothetical protein A0H81_01525 [Grifola frondosa]|uniref:Uncharacterized protein n=1 Tax=Grifola frondosa TaxID=5627 RepID=A0A1C7MQF5_GRIFR|nr:hypothetical protein A0H81_01525 [Grifola frondosa]
MGLDPVKRSGVGRIICFREGFIIAYTRRRLLYNVAPGAAGFGGARRRRTCRPDLIDLWSNAVTHED